MSVSVTQQKQFIGGEFVESESGETMEVLNPSTGEVIAEVPRGTAEDVDRAVEAAQAAWGEWQSRHTPTLPASLPARPALCTAAYPSWPSWQSTHVDHDCAALPALSWHALQSLSA